MLSQSRLCLSVMLTTRLATSMIINSPKTLLPYSPPPFAKPLRNVPKYRLNLANLPTPLQEIDLQADAVNEPSVLQPLRDLNIQFLVKRDDMSAGVELGGNKIRKLEFLLADALDGGYDSAVTIGGEQSNHCRTTAAACRMVGMEPHLILRSRRANQVEKDRVENNEDSFGYVGNILFDRMVGAQIYTCTPGEYGRIGSNALVQSLCEDIAKQNGKKVYPIPVGGSNALGTWGYIEAANEIKSQLDGEAVDHIVFACGSGGTATGITLGLALAYKDEQDKLPNIHAVGVCDDPDYFYQEISDIAREMGLAVPSDTSSSPKSVEEFIKDHVIMHQGKGLGYASSTQQELEFISKFALETGIVLDPGELIMNYDVFENCQQFPI